LDRAIGVYGARASSRQYSVDGSDGSAMQYLVSRHHLGPLLQATRLTACHLFPRLSNSFDKEGPRRSQVTIDEGKPGYPENEG